MKRLIAILCMLAVITGTAGCGKPADKNTVVTINGEKVGIGEFECYMYFVKKTIIDSGGEDTDEYWSTSEIEGKKAGDVVKETALKNVIEYKLLAQNAIKLGADNSEEMKKEQRQSYIDQIFKGDEASYLARVEEFGVTDEDFTKVIMNDYLAKEYYNLTETETPTEEQIKEYYNKNYYRAQHILIAVSNYTSDTTDGQEEAFAKAQEVKTKLDEGESFEELSKLYNEDQGMVDSVVGYVFTKDTFMPKNFVEVVAELDVGAVSDIVETDFGYHIIKRLDAKEVYEEFADNPSALFADGISTGRDEIAVFVENDRRINVIESWKQEANIKINNSVLDGIKLVKTAEEGTETKE